MIILIGKSGSGKDAIVRELQKHGFNKITTVTTRPPRHDEVNGRSYVFTDERTFRICIDYDLFAEYKVYHSALGCWYYGSLKSDYLTSKETDVIILTPDGYLNVRKYLDKNNITADVFLIETSYENRRKRLEKRGDNPTEIIRRMKADDIDFSVVDFIQKDHIINNDSNIENAVSQIIEKMNERNVNERSKKN